MFKRRHQPGVYRRVRGFVWPHIGWKRAATYLYHRLMRLPGTPHNIAAGFAFGVAISFTPFIGLHFVLAGLLSWLVGGNIIASMIGTAAGNPWTFPLIWMGIYRLGCLMFGWEAGDPLSGELTMTYILERPFAVLLPMVAGGVPAAAAAWLVSYWSVRRIIVDYQALRRRRRAKRQAAGGTRAGRLRRLRSSERKEGRA